VTSCVEIQRVAVDSGLIRKPSRMPRDVAVQCCGAGTAASQARVSETRPRSWGRNVSAVLCRSPCALHARAAASSSDRLYDSRATGTRRARPCTAAVARGRVPRERDWRAAPPAASVVVSRRSRRGTRAIRRRDRPLAASPPGGGSNGEVA
jgi:hypothetical protein